MTRVFFLFPAFLLVGAKPTKLTSLSSPDEEVAASQTHISFVSNDFARKPAVSQTFDSYLSPIGDEEVEASEVVNSYLGPAQIEAAPSEVVSSYLGPAQLEAEPSEVVNSYLGPAQIEAEASETVSSYLGPPEIEAAASKQTLESYFGPSSDIEAASTNSKAYYTVASSSSEALVPEESVVRTVSVSVPTVRPIAILKSAFTGPQDGNYAYSFETENGISQDVEGRMKMVEDSPVYVMQGTYSYIGTDGNTWKVEWYADETGYHPSAPFLPKSVVPDHPEVAAAVADQLRFAADEEAAAAASVNNEVFTLPEAGLAGYGEDHQGAATELLDSYTSLGNSLVLESYGA